MPEIVAVDHGMEKIELAGGRNLPRATQLVRELPIFDFELFEGFEFADIEISGGACRLRLLTKTPDFPCEFDTATGRPRADQIDITQEGESQAPNFAASGRTNKYLLTAKKRGG
jgi:hypothetical protein